MQENDYGFYDYLKPILLGTFVSILSIGIITFLFALMMTTVDVPFGILTPASIVIVSISSLIGSYVGAKKLERKGLFLGLCTATLVLSIILLVNLTIDPQGFGVIAIIKSVAILVCSVFGGVVGVNKKKQAKIRI